jgi:predicted ATPase
LRAAGNSVTTESVSTGQHVFISYATADRPRALHVADLLETPGISVWIDRKSIAGGTSWSSEIVRGIESCAVFVLLSSASALASPNVQQEIQLAWDSRRPILPLILDSARPPEAIRYALAGRQWIEVLDRPDEQWLPEVIRALAGLGVRSSARPGATAGDRVAPSAAPSVFRPASEAPTPPRHNLPSPPSSFIGRQSELAEVTRLLSDPASGGRLLTLIGMGGCGKTRLALQAAARLLDCFPDGIWFVDLAPLSDPSLIPQVVAAVLEIRETPNRPLLTLLTEALRSRSLLLVLDNCEHLIEACARLVDAILQHCSTVRILATSREVLGVTGETTWRVPFFDLLDPEHLPSLAILVASDAVQLFAERARAVAPEFSVTTHNARSVVQICRRLDGIPLAIELAAARVRVLTVEQIDARLDDRFRLLTGGSRTALPRQQTLRSLIDWSHELLAEDEKIVFRRLAAFSGSFGLEAAEEVCSGTEVEADAVLDLLGQLVEKSLVLVERREIETRYRLLETLRQYALDRLRASGELAAVQRRHVDYYVQLVATAEPELIGAESPRWLARLELEFDNLRAVLAWSRAAGDRGELESVEPGLQLAASLLNFWQYRGRHKEGFDWTESLLERSGTEPTAVRAKGLCEAGALAWFLGKNETARLRLQESEAIWRQLGNQQGLARALTFLGLLEGRLATIDEGIAHYRQGNDRYGLGLALSISGILAAELGDFAQSRSRQAESLAIFRAIRAPWGIAQTLNALGDLARSQDDDSGAAAYYRESLAVCREHGIEPIVPSLLHNLGLLALRSGDVAEAEQLYQESLAAFDNLHDSRGVAECLAGLAGVATARHESRRAARLFGAGEALLEDVNATIWRGNRADYERNLAALRAQVDETTLAEAWAAGRALSQQEAVAEAAAATS